jgi:hypothetical protein
MRKFLRSLALVFGQGIVIGLTIMGTVFLTVDLVEDYDPPEFLRELEIESVSLAGVDDAVVGGKEIIVNFIVLNQDLDFMTPVYFDVEFFRSDGSYIYGENKSTLDFVGPKAKDYLSVDVIIPKRINVEEIAEVRLNVYEMQF